MSSRIDPEEWRKAVANTQTIMDFYFDRAFAGRSTRTLRREKRKIVVLFCRRSSVIRQHGRTVVLVAKDCRRLEVRDIHYEEYLRQELKKVRAKRIYILKWLRSRRPAPAKSREKRLEERVLALCDQISRNRRD